MDLYIPEHLRRIGVIKQLCTLIEGYANSDYYVENTSDSFDDYDFALKVDPVKKFLGLCLPEDVVYEVGSWVWNEETEEYVRVPWDKDTQDYEMVINYISKLFYSVKGTTTVLTYMKRYLGLKIVGDILYTPHHIEFYVDELEVEDEGLFRDALEDFLSALLFYEELNVNFGQVVLPIRSDIKSYMNGGAVCFRYYTATPYNT